MILDRKLTRDLMRMKGQAIAIALVIATGVMLLVMMSGIVTSLSETRRAYYERNRLADIFAPVKRAPLYILKGLGELEGVSVVEGRVVGGALINLDSLDLPIRAQAVSLPDGRKPRLNAVYLVKGRMIRSDRTEEILLLNSFAQAHNLTVGDHLAATMNGARRTFRIVGLAQSPEFLYAVAPGELVPDDSRFAVIWMSQTALAATFDMQGAFNQALLDIGRRANKKAILAAIDTLLDPYGGLGAYGLDDQISNRFVSEEIASMRATLKVVPPIFLLVAAFLLNIVVSRMVQADREQIGLIKAFGYSDWEVGHHYLKLVLVIAVVGALVGCLFGLLAGRAMMTLYLLYFKFPILVFRPDWASVVLALLTSIIAASAGGLFVLRHVVALSPAVAMRPPAPADYSRSAPFATNFSRLLDQPSRMILRRLVRQPGRMLGSLVGIACGMALSVAMVSLVAGFDRTMELVFSVLDRSQLTVTFTHAVAHGAVYELEKIDGVQYVEPARDVSVEFRNGLHRYRGGIHGLIREPKLKRALRQDFSPIMPGEDGIVLSKALVSMLRLVPGDLVEVKVLEGRRPTLLLRVSGVAESLMGSPAYMQVDVLNRFLREPGRYSAVYLRLDEARSAQIYRDLKARPNVAGVSVKSDARVAFQRLMDNGAGAMRFVMLIVAGVITFGIVYNAARIAYAERVRDLASLRVMGFTKAETAFVLLGELAVITLLAIPFGGVIGYYLSQAVATGFSTDLYQIPMQFQPESYGVAALAVLVAAILSGWFVKRDIDRVDLVSALKIRE